MNSSPAPARREFLKNACHLGVCACVGAMAAPAEAAGVAQPDPAPEDAAALRDKNRRLEWRLNLARRQLATLLAGIEPLIDEPSRRRIMQQLGRNCAKSLGWASRFKGNPEGFFAHMKQFSGEDLSFGGDGSVINVVTRDRPCDCPLVAATGRPPAYFCDCSVGWQLETYETILGRPVDCTVLESELRGGRRCVFKIQVHEARPVSPDAAP